VNDSKLAVALTKLMMSLKNLKTNIFNFKQSFTDGSYALNGTKVMVNGKQYDC